MQYRPTVVLVNSFNDWGGALNSALGSGEAFLLAWVLVGLVGLALTAHVLDQRAVWKAYPYQALPVALDKSPRQIAPYQQRLDWQMWFAALSNFNEEMWFQAFCERLLEGSPDVLGLIERDPFTGSPPRFLRSRLYQYQFSDRTTRRTSGAWWTSDLLGEYAPIISRQ